MSYDTTVQANNAAVLNVVKQLTPDEQRMLYASMWIILAKSIGGTPVDVTFSLLPPTFSGISDSSHWVGRDLDYFQQELAAIAACRLGANQILTFGVALLRSTISQMASLGIPDRDALDAATATCKASFWQTLTSGQTINFLAFP